MAYDPENPFQGMDKSDPETIKKYFEDEKVQLLPDYYSNLWETKTFRRISMRFIKELSDRFRDDDPGIPYLALTIYDHNLSTFLLPPEKLIVRKGDTQIFVTCCFVSARRMIDSEFSTSDYYEMYKNLNASKEEMDEFITEIEGTLKKRNCTPPITAICFLDFLLGLLTELDKTQMSCLKSFATHKLYALKYDMRLSEFQQSIMAAAALASSVNTFYKTKMDFVINKFCDCEYLNEASLKRSVEMLIPDVTVCLPESPDRVMSDRYPRELTIKQLETILDSESGYTDRLEHSTNLNRVPHPDDLLETHRATISGSIPWD